MVEGKNESVLDSGLNLIDQRFKMEKVLLDEAGYLNRLASALWMVGQRELAENLEKSADRTSRARDDSRRIASEEMSDRIDATYRSLGNTLSLCLRAIKNLGEK